MKWDKFCNGCHVDSDYDITYLVHIASASYKNNSETVFLSRRKHFQTCLKLRQSQNKNRVTKTFSWDVTNKITESKTFFLSESNPGVDDREYLPITHFCYYFFCSIYILSIVLVNTSKFNRYIHPVKCGTVKNIDSQ